MARGLVLAGLLILPAAFPARAQDAKKWAEALATFQRLSGAKDPLDRGRAAWELGEATFEKHDKACYQLVLGLLRQELQKEGPGGKTEEKVAGEVLDGCVRAFRRITHKDVLAEMAKTARNKAEALRVRLCLIWGLAPQGDLSALTELVDDKIPQVQIAAVDALVEREKPESVPVFLRVLGENRTWEVKLRALQGLERAGDKTAVGPLIEGLGKCRADEGRIKNQYIATLQKLTGLELASEEPGAWRAAWKTKEDGGEPPSDATVAETTEFYGLKTRSTRIVFVLDRTGSMSLPCSEPVKAPTDPKPGKAPAPPKEKESPQEAVARDEATRIKKKYDDRKMTTRIDVAKKELITTVYQLTPKAHFNVIWYESKPTPWKQELVAATWPNKLDCIKDVDRIGPSGPTNIWDALEMALQMIEQPQKPDLIVLDKRVNYATATAGADTIFLMTDGRPNEGRIQDPPALLSELRKVNRLRKVAIHTICVGDPPPGAKANDPDSPDPVFLKRLADENGGEFVHIKK
jgi:hypothetical protein